jgi:hypothetical protein
MGKYEPLARYLNSRSEDSWNATFAEIEEALGFALPPSAHQHRAWWSNQKDGNHSQSAGWQAAGWETRDVDIRRRLVRFERVAKAAPKAASGSAAQASTRPELWRQAAELSGIQDRGQLIEAALLALIQREAGRALMAMGGTMPDLVVPERKRSAA